MPDGYVRLGVSAAPYTVALDEIEADPTCHPNGFWGPERDYINTLAKYPLAARYQDQINGGHIGQNYYIPKGGKSLANASEGTLPAQSYDGCITPESALRGAPAVGEPTLVDAKHGYGAIFEKAEQSSQQFLRVMLARHAGEAAGQVQYSGGTAVAWFVADPTAQRFFRQAVLPQGVSRVEHEPLRY